MPPNKNRSPFRSPKRTLRARKLAVLFGERSESKLITDEEPSSSETWTTQESIREKRAKEGSKPIFRGQELKS